MLIEFDPIKRIRTFALRGLDFMSAIDIFAGPTVDMIDARGNYGEQRVLTFGKLDDRDRSVDGAR